MGFVELLLKDPVVKMQTAIDILSYETVMQHGVDYGDSFSSCRDKYFESILKFIVKSNDPSIKYVALYVDEAQEKLYNIDKYNRGFSISKSTVDFKILLHLYNNDLKRHDKQPISIPGYDDHCYNNNDNDKELSDAKIAELVKSIINVVKHTFFVEGKLKKDDFDANYIEYTRIITDKKLLNVLKIVKLTLKEMFADYFTKGRVETVTDKKIQAGIHLAETFRGDKYSDKDTPNMNKALLQIDLPKKDKLHVINIFLNDKK